MFTATALSNGVDIFPLSFSYIFVFTITLFLKNELTNTSSLHHSDVPDISARLQPLTVWPHFPASTCTSSYTSMVGFVASVSVFQDVLPTEMYCFVHSPCQATVYAAVSLPLTSFVHFDLDYSLGFLRLPFFFYSPYYLTVIALFCA